MKLKQVVLKNFRSFQQETRIDIDDFTALIGKNDIGKSSVLEALDIFFNGSTAKVDADDATKNSGNSIVEIGCVFDDLPSSVVIDVDAATTLQDEYLVNEQADLEIHKTFDCSKSKITPQVFAFACHPSANGVSDLLELKNTELKKRLQESAVPVEGVNRAVNNEIRKAIWGNTPVLNKQLRQIPLDKADAKSIWDVLEKALPTYALFQSDRPSRDEDAEVQDPMKAAVIEALKQIQPDLDEIKEKVKASATDVANRTLDKLKELDPHLANELTPTFRAEPKWDQIFKIALTGDDDIPINKRGSGVRRLILLSFFRATAEQKRASAGSSRTIYAIEEPETSQHPNYQRMTIQAFLDLSSHAAQVMITTHNPALASLVPTENLRYVHRDAAGIRVDSSTDDVFEKVGKALGVLPDSRVRVLIYVEGPTDVMFFRRASELFHRRDAAIVDLTDSPFIAFMPVGGSNLKQWVDNRYLRGLDKAEVHVYDRGSEIPPRYGNVVERIRREVDRAYATLTIRREIENYVPLEAIRLEYGIEIPACGAGDSVPVAVAKACYESNGRLWDPLEPKDKESRISKAKKRIGNSVMPQITYEMLVADGAAGEIEGWLREISNRATP